MKYINNKIFVLIIILVGFFSFIVNSQNTCVAPQIITSLPYSLASGTTCGTLNDYNTNLGLGGSTLYTTGEDLIFQFVPAASGSITISVTQPTNAYLGMYLYTGCPFTAYIGGVQNNNATKSFTVTVTTGTTYFLRLDTWSAPFCTSFTNLSISAPVAPPPPPANNDCAAATTLTPGAAGAACTNTAGTSVNATQSLAACAGTADDDVWYQFTATATSHTVTVTPTTMSDVVFQVLSGACNGTSVACIDATSGTSAETTTLTGLTIGTVYRIRVYSWSNGSGQGTFNICVTTPAAPTYDPCASIPTISGCGTSATANFSGTGAGWDVTSCGFNTPGQERIFQFTAPTTGTYTINVSAISGGEFIDFFWKAASGGCTAAGWNCIDDIATTGSYSAITPMAFTAGTTYYILLDPEWTGTYSATFNLVCPSPPYDPCASIPTITDCSTPVTANFSGTGAGWDVTSCGFNTPGQERIFQFTAPTTGTYTINVSAISGGEFIDFFWKAASGGCTAAGWNCIDDIATTGSYSAITPMAFTAGTTYYILLDPEWTGTYSATFNLVCPSPPYDPCASIPTITDCSTSVTANFSGTGAGWDVTSCGFNTPGQERIFQFTAPTTGTYTLNVSAISGGEFIDFFWKPASGGCNSSGWNCIDDIAFTGTYNAITPMAFTAGITYYILLDPEWTGTYSATFNLVCPCNPNAPTGNATQTFCSSSTPTIAGLLATGTDIKWYYAASGGNSLPTSLGLSNGATYYASQTVTGCESASRFAVTVTINPVAVSPAITGSTNLCWNGTTTLTPEYPTGGTITNSGGYRIHTFTTDGTLMVPAGFSGAAEVLVVGGGGGGGSGRGGGGGAGGLLFNSNFTLTAGTSYTVTIGAGGAAETNGNNSVFGSIIANGGGRGGSHDGNSAITTNNGQNGGSGGGAAINFGTSIFNGGTATTSQGNNGGTSGTAGTDDPRNTGGGGGFAEAGRAGSGGNATWTTGVSPKGGDGLYFPQFQSFGSSGWFAGGGGGSKAGSDRSGAPAGAGGQGGGGAGSATGTSSVSGVSGIANTGGGGGGGDGIVNTSNGTLTTTGIGGSGGSGIVIVRYYIGTPTWSSQNTSIATVSNGVVTGGAPGGSTTIDYTVAGIGGCPSTTVSFPVNVIGGRRIAPTGAQCSGTQLNFEALPNPSVSGTSISWNVTTPAGLTATPTSGNTNLFSTTFTNTTLVNLTPTITVSQTIGALTCTRDFTPTIIPLPTVSLNCPNFCAGTPIDITATPTPAGTYTYNWTALPGGVSDPGNSATVNTSTAGMYTVIATNTATNCASEATSCTIAVQAQPSIIFLSPP